MKPKAALATALRKVADKLDPREEERIGVPLAPVNIESLDGFESPKNLAPKTWGSGPGYDGSTYL